MNWTSMNDFFAMGGYALFVWGSVLVTFGLMAAEVLGLRARHAAIQLQLHRLHARQLRLHAGKP